MVKFGARRGSPTPNFQKKLLKGIRPLGQIFTKSSTFSRYSASLHFYTYNVENWLIRTDLGIPQGNKIS